MEKFRTTIRKLYGIWQRMDTQRRKKLLGAVGGVAVVILLAILPMLAANNDSSDGPQSSIITTTVTEGNIQTEIHGGGTLAEEDAVAIRLPAGVKIKEFLVENYTEVKQGDALATVDRVSVMTAISSVQETMDILKGQIGEASSDLVTKTVYAQTAGRVKVVYAQAGDDVAKVMTEHGALAVISLDGLMAVEIETNAALSAGDTLWVTLADGRDVAGRVASALNGRAVITVDDNGYAIGMPVTVTDSDDDELGEGTLYVNSAWNVVAHSGTISWVNLQENTDISAGRQLFTLKNVDDSAEREMLSRRHRDYEELMLELFVMYQSEAILAPCDGVVSGVDHDSIHLLANTDSYGMALLANAPNGDDETAYENFIGKVVLSGADQWSLQVNPQTFAVTDYMDLSGVPMDEAAMTYAANFTPDAPVYELVDGVWTQIKVSAVSVGDVLLFASNSSGKCVWMVRVVKASADPTPPVVSPDVTDRPDGGEGEEDKEPTPTPDGGGMGGGFPNMGGMGGGMPNMGGMQEETVELFDLNGTDILFVTPQDTMTLEITLDEQDMRSVYLGQKAEIAVDVLKGETFIGKVTEIGMTGTSNGGSSKYTVELSFDRGEKMLAGMSATSSFVVETKENVPVIPVAAVNDVGTAAVVYTAKSGDGLTKPVTVELGSSDGEYVEVLSGLQVGDRICYDYYDTPDVSHYAVAK